MVPYSSTAATDCFGSQYNGSTQTGSWYQYGTSDTTTATATIYRYEAASTFLTKAEKARLKRPWLYNFKRDFKAPEAAAHLFRARNGFQGMARIPCYRGVRRV
jgi:hypothetical protein